MKDSVFSIFSPIPRYKHVFHWEIYSHTTLAEDLGNPEEHSYLKKNMSKPVKVMEI